MSELIDSVIQVTTSIDSSNVTSANFGEVLFVKEFSPFDTIVAFQGSEERHRKYTDLDSITADGWEVGSDVYEAGKTFYKQPINSGTFVLGRRDSTDATYTATMEAISDEYAGFYGVAVCYDATTLATTSLYKQALLEVAEWVDANKKISIHATADTGCINKQTVVSAGSVVTGFVADISLWSAVTDGSLSVQIDGGTASDITALDFSAVTALSDVIAVFNTALSGATASVVGTKLQFTSSTTGVTSSIDLADGSTGTSVYSLLNMAYSYESLGTDAGSIPNGTTGVDGTADLFTFMCGEGLSRTLMAYNPNEIDGQHVTSEDVEWFAVGAFADGFAYDPASQTWAYKTIEGVTATDAKPSVLAYISDSSVPRYGNIYTTIKSVDVTYHGRMVDNTPMDVIRGIDWLNDLIQTNLFSLLTRQLDGQRKIPATNAGISLIQSNLLSTLGVASENFLDADTIVVTVPDIDDTDETERADRLLTGVTWSAQLQGAYENIKVVGTLSN